MTMEPATTTTTRIRKPPAAARIAPRAMGGSWTGGASMVGTGRESTWSGYSTRKYGGDWKREESAWSVPVVFVAFLNPTYLRQ